VSDAIFTAQLVPRVRKPAAESKPEAAE